MDDCNGAFYSILKTSLSSLPPSHDHEHETVLAVPITRNPPKCAAKPAANHIALVICGQMQCGFGFKVKTETVKKYDTVTMAEWKNARGAPADKLQNLGDQR